MGFGHRAYKSYGPRAMVIKTTADKVFEVTGRIPSSRSPSRSIGSRSRTLTQRNDTDAAEVRLPPPAESSTRHRDDEPTVALPRIRNPRVSPAARSPRACPPNLWVSMYAVTSTDDSGATARTVPSTVTFTNPTPSA